MMFTKRAAVAVLMLGVLMGAGVATQPTVPPVMSILNRLPKELWPSKNESQARKTQRDDWVMKNFPTSSMTYVGTLQSAVVRGGTGRGVARRGATTSEYIRVTLIIEQVDLWGAPASISVTANVNGLNPDVAAKWEKGWKIGVNGVGSIMRSSINSGGIEVDIKEANVTLMPTKPPTIAVTPTTQPDSPASLDALFASIPEVLWPSNDESTLHKQAREKWILENISRHKWGPWGVSGTIKDIRQVNMQGTGLLVELVSQVAKIEGQDKSLIYFVIVSNKSISEAMGWKVGMKLVGTGMVSVQDPGGLFGSNQPINIQVQDATVTVSP